jgi:hypothetical protein
VCNSVICDGVRYDTPRKLAALLGGREKLIWQGHNPFIRWSKDNNWKDLDLCLCPVDLAATLEQCGFSYIRGDDPMEWFVTRRVSMQEL